MSYIQAMVHYERGPQERERLTEAIVESVQMDPQRREVLNMIKTSAEELMEQGERQGIQKGELNALRETLLRQLRLKFGKVSKKRQRIIEQTEDVRLLANWLDRVLTAENWEDMEIE